MNTLDREDIIGRIISSRVQDILVPSTAFGRPMLVKTTKKDLIARIRSEYAEGQTNLKFRLRPNTNSAIVEAVGDYTRPAEKDGVKETKSASEEDKVLATPMPKKRGRPTNAEREARRLAAEKAQEHEEA